MPDVSDYAPFPEGGSPKTSSHRLFSSGDTSMFEDRSVQAHFENSDMALQVKFKTQASDTALGSSRKGIGNQRFAHSSRSREGPPAI